MGLGPSVCWFGAMAPACPSFLLFLLLLGFSCPNQSSFSNHFPNSYVGQSQTFNFRFQLIFLDSIIIFLFECVKDLTIQSSYNT